MLSHVEPERSVNPLIPRTRQINLLHKRYAIRQNVLKQTCDSSPFVNFQTYKKTIYRILGVKSLTINNQSHEMMFCGGNKIQFERIVDGCVGKKLALYVLTRSGLMITRKRNRSRTPPQRQGTVETKENLKLKHNINNE